MTNSPGVPAGGAVRPARSVRRAVGAGCGALLVLLFFIARCLPALLYRKLVGLRRAIAGGLLQATSLSVPVVAVRIGAQLHTIDADTGAAIIAAGLLTVVLLPPEALMLLSGERRGSDRDASEPESEDTQ